MRNKNFMTFPVYRENMLLILQAALQFLKPSHHWLNIEWDYFCYCFFF